MPPSPLVFNMHDAREVIRRLHGDYGITHSVKNCIPSWALLFPRSTEMCVGWNEKGDYNAVERVLGTVHDPITTVYSLWDGKEWMCAIEITIPFSCIASHIPQEFKSVDVFLVQRQKETECRAIMTP